jgi:two-component system, OmpR family, phosphate regulon response regulator PhoB
MLSTFHVIIADDDDAIRGLIARVVARTYATVTISAVTNGLDALRIYDQSSADLLITNQDMPGISGLGLVEALRVVRLATLPIVMVSADLKIEPRALALGVTRFVAKPFTLTQLAQVLTSLLPP